MVVTPASTVKTASSPAQSVTLAGWTAISGFSLTVSVTMSDSTATGQSPDISTWYWLPFMAEVAVTRRVAAFSPAIGVMPDPVSTNHWYCGLVVIPALVTKVATSSSQTVALTGWRTISGTTFTSTVAEPVRSACGAETVQPLLSVTEVMV